MVYCSAVQVCLQSNYLAQIWVHGDPLQPWVVAVVVPEVAAAKAWADSLVSYQVLFCIGQVAAWLGWEEVVKCDAQGLPSHSLTALCNSRQLKQLVLEEIQVRTQCNTFYFTVC